MKKHHSMDSEKKITELLLRDGFAKSSYYDRNDWYIEWSEEGEKILYRLPAILNYWYELNDEDRSCVEFMSNYFGLKDGRLNLDEVVINMQEDIIGRAQRKLGKRLDQKIVTKIRTKYTSCIGLESILDYTNDMQGEDLESYLERI